jgi:hypothetical protein
MDNEIMYHWLLEKLKQKENEKDNSLYQQVELELPLMEPIQSNEIDEEEKEERGIIIIDIG